MTAHTLTHPAEKRVRSDRRVRPTSFWSTLRLRGRRRGFRRADESRNRFVDSPTPYVIFLALWVTMASALDALLTLLYVASGGGEANPLMALALTYGDTTFVTLKMSITCAGAWGLSVLQLFPPAKLVLHVLTLTYLGILAFHVVLMFS